MAIVEETNREKLARDLMQIVGERGVLRPKTI